MAGTVSPSARGGQGPSAEAWGDLYRRLARCSKEGLEPDELERLAVAAYLTGQDDEAVSAWGEAYSRHLDAGARAEAASCSFWAAFCHLMRGQHAHAGGWLRRTEDAIGDDLQCAARGYLLIPAALKHLHGGDAAEARDLVVEAGRIADRCGDRDLKAFATLGHGQALLALGEQAAGIGLFDDVMLSVVSGEVGPIASGIVYCAVILECMQVFDLARAGEWTTALDAWCRAQPDLVPYRGQCLVHQSQLQQVAGDWVAAAATAEAARDRLEDPPHPALGMAWYQEAELQRLSGELEAAAAAYGRASRAGYQPMPGLALLELARGQVDVASASIRRALSEAVQPFQRPGLLAAAVEILVVSTDLAAADEAALELRHAADGSGSGVLKAMAEHATGAVLLARGKVSEAFGHLRTAGDLQDDLRLPYEAARTAVLLGCGCLALGDEASAQLEFDRARHTFEKLGARPDLERLRTLSGAHSGRARGGLSARELEVLRHVAGGKTNREIAEELAISPHTVARHLENIFAKLGLNSRSAATAYACRHDLL